MGFPRLVLLTTFCFNFLPTCTAGDERLCFLLPRSTCLCHRFLGFCLVTVGAVLSTVTGLYELIPVIVAADETRDRRLFVGRKKRVKSSMSPSGLHTDTRDVSSVLGELSALVDG